MLGVPDQTFLTRSIAIMHSLGGSTVPCRAITLTVLRNVCTFILIQTYLLHNSVWQAVLLLLLLLLLTLIRNGDGIRYLQCQTVRPTCKESEVIKWHSDTPGEVTELHPTFSMPEKWYRESSAKAEATVRHYLLALACSSSHWGKRSVFSRFWSSAPVPCTCILHPVYGISEKHLVALWSASSSCKVWLLQQLSAGHLQQKELIHKASSHRLHRALSWASLDC